MAQVATYLFFNGQTEAAFRFYQQVFQTDFMTEGFMRYGDAPSDALDDGMSEADKALVMHVTLPIIGGHLLMGTDNYGESAQSLQQGNAHYINLLLDTKSEADRLMAALSENGEVTMPMHDTFWGAYFGTCTDQFGVRWMLHCEQS